MEQRYHWDRHETFAPRQEVELEYESEGRHVPTLSPHQLRRRRCRSPCGEQIIDHQHLGPLVDTVAMHFELGGVVLEIVRNAVVCFGKIACLAHGNEGRVWPWRPRGAGTEA